MATAAFLALLVGGYLGLALSPIGQRLLPTAAGIAAKQLCSLVFVSGLEQDRARELYIDPLLLGAAFLVRAAVDEQHQAVSVRIPGFVRRRASHRSGYGCTLELGGGAGLRVPPEAEVASPGMVLDRGHRAAVFDVAKLDAAIDRAFREEPEHPPLNTLAVVVLHDGRLVAEHYAEGITPETRLPGWSMTKSVTATLVGVLVGQGSLDLHAPGAILEWRNTADPRSKISMDHLLRMTSGLLITERNDGRDPNSRMLFQEADVAHFAATRALQAEVGTHFEYMSGSTVLAMRAVQEAIGGDLRDARRFIQEKLFGPLGMPSAVIEPDPAGTLVGSSFMFASARDWARFGQLYLDGGMAGDRRLIPEDWIGYVTAHERPSSRAGYGAGFWIRADDDGGLIVGFHDVVSAALPRDTFAASGFQSQYIHISPSRGLVVVRLGATSSPGHDMERLPFEVVEAIRQDGPP